MPNLTFEQHTQQTQAAIFACNYPSQNPDSSLIPLRSYIREEGISPHKTFTAVWEYENGRVEEYDGKEWRKYTLPF